VVGSLAAYGLSRLRLRGQESLAFWFLSQRMMPLVIVAIPLYLLFREWGLLDTRRGLILAYTNLNLPFVVWMMRTFFDDIPIDLEDASLVDGASRFGTFVRVAVPLAAPGLVATAIFCLVLSWNEFLLALVLTGPNTKTLPLMVAGFLSPSGSQGFNWGPITAMSMVMTLPVFLFSLLVQRHLVRGLTMGALKD
jgi:multiple sugar transport system permease protein